MLPAIEIEPMTAPATLSPASVTWSRERGEELDGGDRGRRAASHAVEHRDHLRHRRHLDDARPVVADSRRR